jgi:electron transfer flavoprotein alpha subunit
MLSILQRSPLLRRALASTCRPNSTLVIAEPTTDSSLAPQTLSAITAASKLHDGPISLLTFSPASAVPELVSTVINASSDGKSSLLAETVSNAVKAAAEKQRYTHVVCAGTKFGSNYLGRIGAMLGVSPVSDVVEVLSDNTFIRPLYAGNALAKVISNDDLKLISIRPTSFDKASPTNESPATESLDTPPNELTEWLVESVSKSERPDLGSASVVISGGRGMKSGENFVLLEKLADKLGAAVGASRAAVDAGFVPNDLQVGQTGKVVAPDLYIAVGISGAIQHLSGMKDSKTIVAINKDGEAPIFQVADLGLVADLFEAVPELTEKV